MNSGHANEHCGVIILDHNLSDPRLVGLIERWWPGAVHPQTAVGIPQHAKDPEIVAALPPTHHCVFVSANKRDFFDQFDGKPGVCIIEVYVGRTSIERLSRVLQKLLTLDPFRPARRRSGIIARITQEDRTWVARWYRKRTDPDRENQVVSFRVSR